MEKELQDLMNVKTRHTIPVRPDAGIADPAFREEKKKKEEREGS